MSSGSPSFIETAVFPSIPPSPTRQTRAFSTSQVNSGPPSPTLSDLSTYSAASLFSNFSNSTKGSLGSSYSESESCYNEYGYPTPQATAKRPRPSLEGKHASRPLHRLPTADSIPLLPSDLDALPDTPTPSRALAFGLHTAPVLTQGSPASSDMDLDLASPFHDSFQEQHGWAVPV